MMKEINFIITSLADVRKAVNAFPFSPAAEAASPVSREKTIRASMLFLDKSWEKSPTVKARTSASAAFSVWTSAATGRGMPTPAAGG